MERLVRVSHRVDRLGRTPPPSSRALVQGWQRQSWPLRILRGFLGITFLYAGLQKLADPAFFHRGTPDYIGTQLHAFAQGSPIGPFLVIAGQAAVLTGVCVALVEMAVGLATILGVAPLLASAVGFGINVVLFLSATWHVHPYFLGSDSMYAVAWAAYGAGLIELQRRTARASRMHGSRASRAAADGEIGRREFLRGTAVALGSVVLGIGAFVAEGREPVAADPPVDAPASASPTTSKAPKRQKPSSAPPSGTPIADLDQVPVGGAVAFDDPVQGPSVLVRLSQRRVAAFSRTCTHAGCLVQYDEGSRTLVCPCHGAEFDPARGAIPVAGPAPTPLAPIKVAVDRSTGRVVAQD